jgi:membrane protein YdbS with pleckstrin-like domain
VKILEITISAKQLIAMIWTLIAVVLSVIIVIEIGGLPFFANNSFLMVAAFFAILLIITLPIYLLIALWGVASKSEAE